MKQIKFVGISAQVIDKVFSALSEFPVDKKLEVVIRDPVRTSRQNRAMHLFFTWIANLLNENNLFIGKELLKDGWEEEWNGSTVKELLWRKTQKSLTGKKSTTQITTAEFTMIADKIQMAFAKMGLNAEFPSLESLLHEKEA